MFGAYGFGQGYFGQGPMEANAPPEILVDGPIHVDGLERCGPEVLAMTSRRARANRVRAKKPSVTNTEQCP